MTPKSRQPLGKWGEDRAAAYLAEQGYHILARNWRCEAGEADIVALEGGELVVVEVRTRRGPAALEQALISITPVKQQRLASIAALAHSAFCPPDAAWGLRVDVVAVAPGAGGAQLELMRSAISE